jgi:hypothetical protein
MNRIPHMNAGKPAYSIFRRSSREPLDTLEMHVLARAYRAAWRSIHARDPVNAHPIESLDLMIVFRAQA